MAPDGSGNYSNTKTSVNYNLDGKGGGVYNGPNLNIINNGDGTAMVNGQQVKADKAPIVGKVGKFPWVVDSPQARRELRHDHHPWRTAFSLDSASPIFCPEAAATLLKKLFAEVLTSAKVPAAHVYGHTGFDW